MDNLKSILILLILLAFAAGVGYWAIVSLEPGNIGAERQKREALESENEKLREEMEELKKEFVSLKSAEEKVKEEAAASETRIESEPAAAVSKYQNLINRLQEITDSNITMKEKSKGTRVGTVQEFLNLYNGTSSRIDNDYGKSTKAAIAEFQKKEGLTADGEAGPATFKAMIEWLKEQ